MLVKSVVWLWPNEFLRVQRLPGGRGHCDRLPKLQLVLPPCTQSMSLIVNSGKSFVIIQIPSVSYNMCGIVIQRLYSDK